MIITNWCVITGAPSSGKTSVIEDLKKRGYAVEGEVARELIERMMAQGKDLSEIRSSQEAVQRLQHEILDIKLAREKNLPPEKRLFMDRGMGDSITYFRLAGLDVSEAVRDSLLFRYKAIFIFNRIPLKKDNIRTENDSDADKIDKMLEEDYVGLGYTPIRVGVMSITQRTDFILKSLGDQR